MGGRSVCGFKKLIKNSTFLANNSRKFSIKKTHLKQQKIRHSTPKFSQNPFKLEKRKANWKKKYKMNFHFRLFPFFRVFPTILLGKNSRLKKKIYFLSWLVGKLIFRFTSFSILHFTGNFPGGEGCTPLSYLIIENEILRDGGEGYEIW